MNITPTPEAKANKEEAKAAVQEVNPTSPLAKPMWKTGNFWVTVAGACAIISSRMPEVVALLPEGHKSRDTLLTVGIAAALLGSILAQLNGVQSAADVHAVRNLPPQ